MSGGSFDYKYADIESTYVGCMRDREMDDLVKDLVEVMHDLEWWTSADICEEAYRATVAKFKKKWFGDRKVRLQGYVDKACAQLKRELTELITDGADPVEGGDEDDCK